MHEKGMGEDLTAAVTEVAELCTDKEYVVRRHALSPVRLIRLKLTTLLNVCLLCCCCFRYVRYAEHNRTLCDSGNKQLLSSLWTSSRLEEAGTGLAGSAKQQKQTAHFAAAADVEKALSGLEKKYVLFVLSGFSLFAFKTNINTTTVLLPLLLLLLLLLLL